MDLKTTTQIFSDPFSYRPCEQIKLSHRLIQVEYFRISALNDVDTISQQGIFWVFPWIARERQSLNIFFSYSITFSQQPPQVTFQIAYKVALFYVEFPAITVHH